MNRKETVFEYTTNRKDAGYKNKTYLVSFKAVAVNRKSADLNNISAFSVYCIISTNYFSFCLFYFWRDY